MGTYATSTDVSAVRDALSGYVSSITHTDANTATLLQTQAQLSLDSWADCQLSAININGSAAKSYSSAVGNSVQKKDLDDVLAMSDRHMSDFVRYCALGGVTVPTMGGTVSYWDMSGVSRE